MQEDVKAAVEVAGTGAGLGGATGVVRMVVLGQPGGFPAYVSILVASLFVGMLAGLVASSIKVEGAALSEKLQWACIIISALTAKDLMTGLRTIGTEFATDPLAIFFRIVKALRGK